MNKKAKATKAKPHKKSNKKVQRTAKKSSFNKWCKTHRKALLITYYSAAAIVVIISISIILNSITIIEIVKREEPIYYLTEYIDDNNLELGTEKVEQEGVNGSRIVYYKERKKWLSGEVLDSDYDSTGEEKDPTRKIVRRGTRRWQYMICSDGGYWYYTDEQFKDPKVGYTHSSEDQCAKNNNGQMVALADTPPVDEVRPNSGSSHVPIPTYEYHYTPSTNYNSGTEPFESSITNSDPFAEENARQEAERQKRANAERDCKNKAERARESARRQLGAMGVTGSDYNTVPQSAYESTYHSCMRSYGY